jgi:transposase
MSNTAQSHKRREPVMPKDIRYVGLDVHATTITVAVADAGREGVQPLGTIPHQADAVARLVRKLGPARTLRVCYEAGPCGYGLYWQLAALGIACTVVAPTLVPVRAGDRVKTDRRDAEKLAQCLRAGTVAGVWVPSPAQEALRDLVRARAVAKQDQLRARHRLGKFLLRHGRRRPGTGRAWTMAHLAWVRSQTFPFPAQDLTFQDYLHEVDHAGDRVRRLDGALDHAIATADPAQRALVAALQALRGVSQVTALTVVAELGCFSRFSRAKQLMGYTGLVPREASSGPRVRRGAITKTGNAHLRHVLGEAAWTARYQPARSPALQRRQAALAPEVVALAWQAQVRLHHRYRRLLGRGKIRQQVITAVARELVGFMWAIGVWVEQHEVTRRVEAIRAA